MASSSKYKLLALDIDGTLVRNDRTISDTTRQTLLLAQQQGTRIVIASGRPAFGIAPLADQLQLARYGGFVLSYNGAEIFDWQSGEAIYQKPLPTDIIPTVCSQCKSAGFYFMTYCGSTIVTETPLSPYIQLSSKRNGMTISAASSFLDAIQLPLFKIMIVGEPAALAEFEPRLNSVIAGRAVAFRSERFYLEVVPCGIDKASCLGVILSRLGLTAASLMACGDGYNDISMIQFAGMGVAMENANEQVKQSADYITLSNEADGIAAVVRKFILA